MRKTIGTIFLLSLASLALAQTAEVLIAKADSFGYKQLDSAIHYWELGGELALDNGNNELAIPALEQAAGSHLFLDNHEKAARYYEMVFRIAESATSKAEALNGMSHRYLYDDQYEADSIFQLALKYAYVAKDSAITTSILGNYAVYLQRDGDMKGAIASFVDALNYQPQPLQKLIISSNIAQLFMLLDNPDRAKEYIDIGLDISTKEGYKARYQQIAILLGRYHREKGNLELAKKEFLLIIEKNKDLINSSIVEAYFNLAILAFDEKDYARANELLEKSKAIKSIDDISLSARQGILAARIALVQENFGRARQITDQLLTDYSNIKFDLLEKAIYELSAIIYEKQGNAAKAFAHFREYKKLQEINFRTNQALEVLEQEAKYKRKEQAAAITLLDQENQIQTLKLQEKNNIILLGGIGLVIFSILSFFLYRFYNQVKKQRNIIKSSLDEKEILLREIHHRVKNNLQMVSSLLSLQSRYIKDDAAIEAIKQSKIRVRSIALIHQDLYSHENLKGVGVKDFLHKLCSELYSAYNISNEDIQLHLDIADISLEVDSMIPIGLIMNELLVNALKYAFPNNATGEIRIVLKEEEEKLLLVVSDNGVGFDYDEALQKSFGYKLIRTLAQRLRGEMSVDTSNGSKVIFRFSKYKTIT